PTRPIRYKLPYPQKSGGFTRKLEGIPMALPRFHVAPLPSSGGVPLPDGEARHALKVLRLRPGDAVVACDGVGGEALAQIAVGDDGAMRIEIVERTDTDRELARPLILCVALPK